MKLSFQFRKSFQALNINLIQHSYAANIPKVVCFVHSESKLKMRHYCHYLITLLLMLQTNLLSAGIISGYIRDRVTREPLISANVVIVGTPYGACTDLDGFYSISGIEPDRYTLRATMLGYEDQVISNVAVLEEGITRMDFFLLPTALQMEEVRVSAGSEKGSQKRELEDRLSSTAIVDAVSAETMRGLPDPDIAQVVTRTTGVSSTGGDPIIRGMGVRYSKITLNGSQLSGTEPNRSAVSLDLFPAALMQQVTINKSYLPDQFGEFGGGIINMNTWEYAGDPGPVKITFSAGGGYRAGTTFEQNLTYPGGKWDFIGFDDGTRALPWAIAHAGTQIRENLPSHALEYYSESFPNNWETQTKTAQPNQSYSCTISQGTTFLGRELGYIASGLYRNGSDLRTYHQNAFAQGQSPDALVPIYSYQGTDYNYSTTLGGIGALKWRVSPLTTFNANILFNRDAEDQVRVYQGPKNDQGVDIRATRFRFVGESIFTAQVRGEHTFPKFLQSSLIWRITGSRGVRYEPDTRQINYRWDDINDQWGISLGANPDNSGTRIFNDLSDNTWTAGMDIRLYPHRNVPQLSVKTGFDFLLRHREAESRVFRYEPVGGAVPESLVTMSPEQLFTPEYLNPNFISILERTQTTDDYTADQDLKAAYLMLDLPFAGRWQFIGGARVEQSLQKVTSFERFNPTNVPVEGRIFTTDALPAMTLIYALPPDSKLRFAASQTVSRPDFRELSLYRYSDYDGGYSVIGNPDLERALIRNFDLRYEKVWGGTNLVSVGLFYKQFDHPIEVVRVSGSAKDISYFNARSAYNYGIELEWRLELGWLGKPLKPFSLSSNLTLLKSEVQIDPDISGVTTSGNRPLQGQSPYLWNLDVKYFSHRYGTQADLLFQVFGKRIAEVGTDYLPDIYEMPHPDFDLTFRQPIGSSFAIRGSAENLLDPEIRFLHGGSGDFYTQTYRQGRAYSLGITYTR